MIKQNFGVGNHLQRISLVAMRETKIPPIQLPGMPLSMTVFLFCLQFIFRKMTRFDLWRFQSRLERIVWKSRNKWNSRSCILCILCCQCTIFYHFFSDKYSLLLLKTHPMFFWKNDDCSDPGLGEWILAPLRRWYRWKSNVPIFQGEMHGDIKFSLEPTLNVIFVQQSSSV